MAKSLPPRERKIGQNMFIICSRQEQKKDKVEKSDTQASLQHNDNLYRDHTQPSNIKTTIKLFKNQKTLCKLRYKWNTLFRYKRDNEKKLRIIYYEDISATHESSKKSVNGERSDTCFDIHSYLKGYLQLAKSRIGVFKVKTFCYHTSTVSVVWKNQNISPLPLDIAVRVSKWKERRRNVSVREEDENYDVHCISLSHPLQLGVKETGQQIHDLTSLPHSKYEPAPVKVPPNSIELVICPGRRKSNRGGQRSRPHRPQNSQSTNSRDEEENQPPIQVRDDAHDLPNRDNTVTSMEPVLGRTGLPVTTNLMSSIDSEERLAARRRGTNQNTARALPLRPPRYPEYADRDKRQASFTTWPQTTMQDPSNMAEQGFFFTGRQDLVRCFQCGIGMKDWSESDEPLFEHVRHSPECSFLLDHLGPELLAAYKINLIPAGAQPTTQRFTGQNSSTQGRPASATQGNTAQSRSQGTGANTSTTSTATSNVRSPQYSTIDARIRSFNKDWPTNVSQTPHQLAEAGFYFSGYGDVCRCFTCDGGLQRWDPQDDPWIEHARWFPECEHVRQTRGQDYIDLVQRAAATQSSDEDSDPVVESSLSGAMAGLSLNDSESLSTEAAKKVLEKGYSRKAVLLAVHELQVKGTREPTEQSILDILRGKEERGEALPTDTPPSEAVGDLDPERENGQYTSPAFRMTKRSLTFSNDPNYLQEENERLRRKIKCIQCDERDANMLFIPCTHHRMCEECAENVQMCPVCGREIQQKVKTYMS